MSHEGDTRLTPLALLILTMVRHNPEMMRTDPQWAAKLSQLCKFSREELLDALEELKAEHIELTAGLLP